MPIVSTAKMTARQFLQLGEDPPGVRLELVDGEIAVSASPFPQHSVVVTRLGSILQEYIFKNELGMLLGDCDTIFGEHDVRTPDLLFFTSEREHLVLPDEAIDGAPDLCIEVISKTTADVDRVDKFKQYAAGKVRFYWIVDPIALTIEAYKLSGKGYKLFGKGSHHETVSFAPFSELEIPLGLIWFKKVKRNGSR
jgi:Uma2 family endonuclease